MSGHVSRGLLFLVCRVSCLGAVWAWFESLDAGSRCHPSCTEAATDGWAGFCQGARALIYRQHTFYLCVVTSFQAGRAFMFLLLPPAGPRRGSKCRRAWLLWSMLALALAGPLGGCARASFFLGGRGWPEACFRSLQGSCCTWSLGLPTKNAGCNLGACGSPLCPLAHFWRRCTGCAVDADQFVH